MPRLTLTKTLVLLVAAAFSVSGLWCACAHPEEYSHAGGQGHQNENSSHGHSHGHSDAPTPDHHEDDTHECECQNVLAAVAAPGASTIFVAQGTHTSEGDLPNLPADSASQSSYWIARAEESPPANYTPGAIYLDHGTLLI